MDAIRVVLDVLSDDEDDLLMRERRFLPRVEGFASFDEAEFKKRFRLSKQAAFNLLLEIEHLLEYPSNRNQSVSPANQLLLCLRYYATGSFSVTIADLCGVSKATANRVIHRVTKVICSLRPKYVRFPITDNEIREAQLLNFGVASFPRVVGIIDCTHIRIQSPGGNDAELHRNRKGYFSFNVQIICNVNLDIIDIVARWPGSAHDSTIFSSCCRKAMFEDDRYGDALLIGDSGYPLLSYLMTPMANTELRAQELYNESLIRTRNCVERTIGVWKRRFPVLAIGCNLKIKNIMSVIVATAVLHNILRNDGDPPEDDPDLQLPLPWAELLDIGQIHEPQAATNNRRGQAVQNELLIYFQRLARG